MSSSEDFTTASENDYYSADEGDFKSNLSGFYVVFAQDGTKWYLPLRHCKEKHFMTKSETK